MRRVFLFLFYVVMKDNVEGSRWLLSCILYVFHIINCQLIHYVNVLISFHERKKHTKIKVNHDVLPDRMKRCQWRSLEIIMSSSLLAH